MKKLIVCLAVCLSLVGCRQVKTIDGKTYDTYGLLNENVKKNAAIEYEISAASVIVAVIFCETIIVPVYILGFDLYQPVGKASSIDRGVIRGN